MDILILVGSFTVVCLLGMPVAYALGLASICAALYIGIPLEAVMLKVAGGMSGFSLLAIPFFILAGAIMSVGGMAERLVNLARVFVGALRGGMALVNILASTMFGCISGSSVADTAAVGSVMIPQMIKAGYPRLFAVNVTISGSLQPLLVPPSHNMVIYSIAAGGTVSIGSMFMAGIIPALLLGLSLIVLVLIIAHRDKMPKGEVVPLRQALKIALDAVWGMITVGIILGGILSGVFTPTESGAVACVYAFCVTMFVYRDVKWSELPALIGRVVRTVGMVMIMIGFSIAFGYMMAIMRVPALATEFFVSISSDKYMFLLWINILLLLLGTFMDLAPMLLICTPIFLPIISTFGIDPVHFGIIMILNLGIGLLTPPVGPTMVVGCAIGRVSMEAVSKSIMIFYIPMLIVLMLVTYIPALSLWLPSVLMNSGGPLKKNRRKNAARKGGGKDSTRRGLSSAAVF
jgi:tripartite ATP-independent transporter DctM subunit